MMHHDNDQIPMKTHGMTMVPDVYLLPSLSTIQVVIHHSGEQIGGPTLAISTVYLFLYVCQTREENISGDRCDLMEIPTCNAKRQSEEETYVCVNTFDTTVELGTTHSLSPKIEARNTSSGG